MKKFSKGYITNMLLYSMILIVIIVVSILVYGFLRGGTFQAANLICGFLGVC